MPAIHDRFERLNLYVREESPSQLETGVVEGRYDLALTPLPLRSKSLSVDRLFREPLLLVTLRAAGLAEGCVLQESELARMSILSLDERHQLHKEVRRICERTGAVFNRFYEGTSLETPRQIVVMGMGLAFPPALYIRSEIHCPEELDFVCLRTSEPGRRAR